MLFWIKKILIMGKKIYNKYRGEFEILKVLIGDNPNFNIQEFSLIVSETPISAVLRRLFQ